jgi:hypothetical protein
MTVHLLVGRWVDGVCRFVAACGVEGPLSGYWSINKDLVTCWKCKQKA